MQTTELVHRASYLEVGCTLQCDSEISTLVDFSSRDGRSETSDRERETSTSDDTTKAQMLDADERAWDSPRSSKNVRASRQ